VSSTPVKDCLVIRVSESSDHLRVRLLTAHDVRGARHCLNKSMQRRTNFLININHDLFCFGREREKDRPDVD